MAHFYFSSFEKGAPAPLKPRGQLRSFGKHLPLPLWWSVPTTFAGVGWRRSIMTPYGMPFPLVIAETLAYCGTILFTLNLWQVRDVKRRPPPRDIRQCLDPDDTTAPRPVKVDLFIATYSEDTELVRLSIQDAKRVTYPFPWIIAFTFWMTASAPRCAASPNKKA